MDKTKNLVELTTKETQGKKGYGIVIADLSEIDGTICRYFVTCQGNSTQQVGAIAGSVSDYACETIGEKSINCAGLGNTQRVAIDYAGVIVHIFTSEIRKFYDIEHLWEDAKLATLLDLD